MRKLAPILAVLLFLLPSLLMVVPSAGATPYIIHGQVTWGDGLSPVSNATITLTNIDRDQTVYTKSVQTDDNGLYSITVGVNEPGDFANMSQTINITVTYTTSKGEVIRAYAAPIVVGSPEETSANFKQEINFSLTPIPDSDSGGWLDAYLFPIALLVVALIVLSLLSLFVTKKKRKGR